MQCRELTDGSIDITTPDSTMLFEKTFASLSWPDEAPGHLLVLGVFPDGLLRVLSERSGGLFELGAHAIEYRKEFLIDMVIVDDRDRVSTLAMRSLEGLAFDMRNPGHEPARPLQAGGREPASPLSQDAVCICPASSEILNCYRGALERTRALILSRRIIIDESVCPELAQELIQPMGSVLNSAAVRALVLASGMIPNHGAPEPHASGHKRSWYMNRRR